MMTREEAKTVRLVYKSFIDSESREWTDVDDNLQMFEWLSDEETIRECEIKLEKDLKGTFRCVHEHEQKYCFSPVILEAVESIVKLYRNTKILHPKNKYILIYYLVMSEMKLIYVV